MSPPKRSYLTKRNMGVDYIAFFEDGRKRWESIRCRTRANAVRTLPKLEELFRERSKPETPVNVR